MNRRDFISWVGVGGVASFLPVAIAACSSQNSSPASQEWQKVGSLQELDRKGELLNENTSAGSVLVVGTSKSGNLNAVNPTCTHAGCTVAWKAADKKFACPCHGSEYEIDGQVKKGPAKKPLTAYQVKIEGDSVLVKGT
ncbi:MAG: ubiquinol-cytochrome c reductase iron-sulfur subunit [Nostocaceae cyanobacterium]|nr:ubiquinol-cytochrome c reductase iron-sulfur subunit [Nostocaceae cyanobacterium]